MLVKVDASKLGKPKNFFKISAILKTTKKEGEDTKEIAMYLDHSAMAVLYATATIPDVVENKGAVKVGRVEINSEKQKNENENGVCECEARIRGFMRMLRIGEGTKDEGGYTRIVGGSSFDDHGKDFSDHPHVYYAPRDSYAAGAYQITLKNWNENPLKSWRENNSKWLAYKKKYNLESFSKKAQDAYGAFLIINKKNAFDEIKNGEVKAAIIKCGKEWASLPGAGYGQREEKLSDLVTEYEKLLKEELSEKTTLHIEKGFLKELFDKNCCNNKPYTGSAIVNEFGLVQVTKLGNPYIIDSATVGGIEDSYSYKKKGWN